MLQGLRKIKNIDYAPTGMEMQFIRADIKEGGSSFYFMTGIPGVKMYGKAEYLKIEKPNLIVYKQHFADENENLSRHPLAPTWPSSMLTMVKLTEESPGKTRVTIAWEPCDNFGAEELQTFIKGRGGMTQGWTGSFDKLGDYLEAIIN